MIAQLTNHLWQSTLFAIAAALLAFALRRNRAGVRHALWVTASIKFFLPFSLLIGLGSALASAPVPVAPASSSVPAARAIAITVNQIAQPFDDLFVETPTPSVPLQSPRATGWPRILLLVWAAGVVVIAWRRLSAWRRIRSAVRSSVPFDHQSVGAAIAARSTPDLLEPGIVGVFRPLLLLPAGIEQYLAPSQLQAVIEHELCHVRRRDNLTAAIHMLVEALFWFHPLVWWIGARLVDERERACDEHVLATVPEPSAYAEGILGVCKRYVESPVACVSGVTGSDLKKRITDIINHRVGSQLTLARRVVLLMSAIAALVLPFFAGIATAPLRAQAGQTPTALQVKFDVVSIKPCPGIEARPPGSGRGVNPGAPQISPGYVHWDCVTLAGLLDQAWGGGGNGPRANQLRNTLDRPQSDGPKRVRGGPSWVHEDRFTIEIKVSGDVTELTGAGRFVLVRDSMIPALQAMLEDRFQLKFRKATEQVPMYAMTVAKGGLKIKQTAPQDCWRLPPGLARGAIATPPPGFEGTPACGINVHGLSPANRIYEVEHANLQDFARFLGGFMDRFVLDQTGVLGRFSFKLEFAPDDSTPGAKRVDNDPGFDTINGVRVPAPARPPATGPNIFKALEALGLKLDPTKGPSEYFLVEGAQRPKPNSPGQ
jgi:bla regulator protein BlaR1